MTPKEAIDDLKLKIFSGLLSEQLEDIYLLAIEALEKQVTKQWKHEEDFCGETIYVCPVCDEFFSLIDGTMQDNNYNHCPACGQRLEDWDWSEEE